MTVNEIAAVMYVASTLPWKTCIAAARACINGGLQVTAAA